MRGIIIFLLYALSLSGQIDDMKNYYYYQGAKTISAETTEYKRLIDSTGGSITTSDLNATSPFYSKVSSFRQKLIRINLFGGNNLTTALVPLIRGTALGVVYGYPIDVNMNFVVGNYTRTGGLGDPSNGTKYLKTGIIPSTCPALTLNSMGMGVWGLTNRSASTVASMGDYNATLFDDARLYIRYTGDVYRAKINTQGSGAIGTSSSTIGFIYASRTASNLVTAYYNGVSAGTSSNASTALVPYEIFVFSANSSGSPSTFETINLSGYVITTGLTASEQLILYNAIHDVLVAWGRL